MMQVEVDRHPSRDAHRAALASSVDPDRVLDLLRGLRRDASEDTSAENMALIQTLAQPAHACALLRAVLGRRSALAEIAARSYRHTNHFDKIVLVDSRNHLGYRLTMHLWAPPYTETEIVDEQIHDHRFSFWSAVLLGRMTFQNYVRDATGVMFNEYQYIPEKRDVSTVGNFYIDVGQSPLLEVDASYGTAGESYHLAYNTIHRVELPMTEMACTLVLRGPRQKNYASVFSNSRKYDPDANRMFSSAELAARLSLVLGRLEESLS